MLYYPSQHAVFSHEWAHLVVGNGNVRGTTTIRVFEYWTDRQPFTRHEQNFIVRRESLDQVLRVGDNSSEYNIAILCSRCTWWLHIVSPVKPSQKGSYVCVLGAACGSSECVLQAKALACAQIIVGLNRCAVMGGPSAHDRKRDRRERGGV